MRKRTTALDTALSGAIQRWLLEERSADPNAKVLAHALNKLDTGTRLDILRIVIDHPNMPIPAMMLYERLKVLSDDTERALIEMAEQDQASPPKS